MKAAGSPASTGVRAVCFGKVPGCADFVRCGSEALTSWLDRWIEPALRAVVEQPHWRVLYDRAPPLQFAVLDAGSGTAVCGHLQPSSDAAGRRFPLVVGIGQACADPRARLARAPLVFARAWRRCSEAARQVAGLRSSSAVAAALDEAFAGLRVAEAPDYDAISQDHAATESLASLQQRLRPAHGDVDPGRTLIRLGEAAATLRGPRRAPLPGVALPLPDDPLHQSLTAAWWTALLAEPVAAAERELLLMRPVTAAPAPNRLLVGFDGASAESLSATWDPARADDRFIDLAAPARTPTPAPTSADRGAEARRLACCLGDGGLSLALAADMWRETFGRSR